jgi:hypothetical protein
MRPESLKDAHKDLLAWPVEARAVSARQASNRVDLFQSNAFAEIDSSIGNHIVYKT